jgi:hypothetical protein
MALKLHEGASLAVLALTQFNFCSRGHRKYVSITLPSLGGLQAPCPRAITAVIDMSCRKGKTFDGITSQNFNLDVSDMFVAKRCSPAVLGLGVRLQNVLHV